MAYEFTIACGEQEINHSLRVYNEGFEGTQKVGSTTEYEYPFKLAVIRGFLRLRDDAVYPDLWL